jgi:hypothetical protein
MHVEFLPACAPDPKVVDHCWGPTKYGAMANCLPDDVTDLTQEGAYALLAKLQRPDLLRAFFQQAQLPL